MSVPRSFSDTLLFLGSILILGCNESTTPRTGTIQVTVTTTGATSDRDSDGYTLKIDDRPGSPIDINATVTIADVAIGTHSVMLEGLQANCSPTGSNPRTVEVTGGKGAAPATVSFFVSCVQKTGSIVVTTVTTGSDLDPDGYTVVAGGPRGTIPANGTLTVTGVTEGAWGVTLSGLSLNCAIDPPATKIVTVTSAAPVQVAFSVRCVPTLSLRVTLVTTGVDLDADGYNIQAQLAGSSFVTGAGVQANGTATLTGLAPGDYAVTLSEVEPNCDAAKPGPQTVSVAANPTALTIEVTCEKGRQLAYANNVGRNADIYVIGSNNAGATVVTSDATADADPAWSPDGSKIAFTSERGGNYDIYVMSADGTNQVRLTTSTSVDNRPAWSPDGAKIAFASVRDGNAEIYVMNADGSSQVRITNDIAPDSEPAWSPDGTKIAFSSGRPGGGGIWIMNPDGSGLNRLTTNSRGDWSPDWSPDGTRIAFSSEVSASTRDIYVMNADGTGVTSLTSGYVLAQDPSWSPDGRKIAFSSPLCADYYYYHYYCDARLLVVGLDRTIYASLTTPSNASNPMWRP
ncbi:MAG TPA: hypothetical protein VES88_01075 [Gemmatimonadaceae bacterium]|nr:hypothetical protein [Gemmatimonadaceae bacterium]